MSKTMINVHHKVIVDEIQHAPQEKRKGFEIPSTITLHALCNRLGFSVTQQFLARIGFEAIKDKRSNLYYEHDFGRICDAIITRLKIIGGK